MTELKKKLESSGHTIHMPAKLEEEVPEYYWKNENMQERERFIASKHDLMRSFFKKIKTSDIVIIANYEKKGTPGYIGANTFMEMTVAFYLNKPIYLLHNVPDMPLQEEIWAMKPVILNDTIDTIVL